MMVLFVDHFLTFCSALDIINMNGPSHGLFLYRSKGVLVVSAEASCEHSLLPPEIPVSAEGFCLLGSPFGFSSFYIFYFKKISEDSWHTHFSEVIPDKVHIALFMPKISFPLRICAPQLIKPALVAFDDTMRDALSDIAGGCVLLEICMLLSHNMH